MQSNEGSRTRARFWGVAVNHLDIEQLAVTVRSGAIASTPARYELDRLELTQSAASDSLAVELQGSLNGQPAALSGQTGLLRDLFAGVSFPLALSGDVAGAKVKLYGGFYNLATLAGLDLTLEATGSDLATLGTGMGFKIPQTDSFDLVAQLTTDGDRFAVRDARGSASYKDIRLALNGDIGDLKMLREIQLELKGSGNNLAELGSLVVETLSVTGAFVVSGKLTGSAKKQVLSAARGTVSRQNNRLSLAGGIDELLSVTGISLDVKASGTNLGELRSVPTEKLPDTGPFSATVTVDQSDLNGWAKVEFGKRTRVTLRLESGLVDFTRIMGQVEGVKKTGAGTTEKDRKGGTRQVVFSDEPLPFDLLNAVDADVTFNARNIKARDAALEFGQLTLQLDTGDLRIDKLEATYEGTRVSANLNLKAGMPAKVAVNFLVQGFDLGRFLKEIQLSQDIEGLVDLAADLKSQGDSPRSLAANVNGLTAAVIGKGYVPRFLDLLAQDLSSRVITIWGRHKKSGELNCGVVQFSHTNGIARSDVFLFDTQLGILKGDGEINLATEKIDFLLSPEPKDNSLFSLATKLRVTGSVLDPRVRPDMTSVAKKGAKALSSLVLGPAGLLLPFMKSGARNQHPCDVQALRHRVHSIYD